MSSLFNICEEDLLDIAEAFFDAQNGNEASPTIVFQIKKLQFFQSRNLSVVKINARFVNHWEKLISHQAEKISVWKKFLTRGIVVVDNVNSDILDNHKVVSGSSDTLALQRTNFDSRNSKKPDQLCFFFELLFEWQLPGSNEKG